MGRGFGNGGSGVAGLPPPPHTLFAYLLIHNYIQRSVYPPPSPFHFQFSSYANAQVIRIFVNKHFDRLRFVYTNNCTNAKGMEKLNWITIPSL